MGLEIPWLYALAEGFDPTSKRGVLNMTLNCIWWWGSSSKDLGSVEYLFIVHYTQAHTNSKF